MIHSFLRSLKFLTIPVSTTIKGLILILFSCFQCYYNKIFITFSEQVRRLLSSNAKYAVSPGAFLLGSEVLNLWDVASVLSENQTFFPKTYLVSVALCGSLHDWCAVRSLGPHTPKCLWVTGVDFSWRRIMPMYIWNLTDSKLARSLKTT